METKTTKTRLNKTPENAPQVLCSVRENISPASLQHYSNVNSPVDNSVSCFHLGSGYNSEQSEASMSGRIFVLSETGKPLTPCKPQKARKLILGRVAIVVWNKFGQFGIQMLVQTREFTPKTILGIDWGTKFEGISLISGSDNLLNVMWLLPDKKVLVRKLKEKSRLRRARRQRNCRRREARFNNRSKDGFISPSQLMMVNSRLKCIKEFFKCYQISKVAIENVKFNHRDKRWGKNFSTIEIGKNMIYDFIKTKADLSLFEGRETKKLREELGLKKSSNKSAEHFNSHCVDSFTLAYQFSEAEPNFNIKIVDDRYRPTRRSLYDTQPANGKNLERQKKAEQKGKFTGFKKEGGYFAKYSNGNFKGIRKGTIFELGQIIGGTGNNVYYQDWDGTSQKGKVLSKISWYSKQFKWRNSPNHLLPNKNL